MTRRNFLPLAAIAAVTLLPANVAIAADAPAIKVSESNAVPACATPGRLMEFLRSHNANLDPRFQKIAVDYMREGEKLHIRWDYTFYQMILETGHLTYRGDRGRRGDVKPTQNNFAGIGATGSGEPGESFPDVATGVLAHLQHVLLYAGETVDAPVAERTRKVQEWGILKSMQKKAHGSVTFAHLAKKWAPGSDYVSGLEAIAQRFNDGFCSKADPQPDWVAEARGSKPPVVAANSPAEQPKITTDRVSGADLARRAIAEGKAGEVEKPAALGGAAVAKAPSTSYSLLNGPIGETVEPANPPAEAEASPAAKAPALAKAESAPKAQAKPAAKAPAFVTASAAGMIAKSPAAKPAAGKCRVWTASYGGQKAMIIRVTAPASTDYTVLDVNEGAESREADAYISAYAKGGIVEGTFASQQQALDKAFELCPEN